MFINLLVPELPLMPAQNALFFDSFN